MQDIKKYADRLFALKQTSGAQYGATLAGVFTKSLLLLFFTAAAMLVLLFAGKLMWEIYTWTPVGQKYVDLFPETAAVISGIVNDNLFLLSAELSSVAVLTCLLTGAVLQVSGLYRLLYLSRGLLGRIIFVVVPLYFAVVRNLHNSYGYEDYTTACLLGALPTLWVYARCLDYAAELVPEITDIFTDIKKIMHTLPEMITKFLTILTEKRN